MKNPKDPVYIPHPPILKQGYASKLGGSKGGFRTWNKRFFVLDSMNLAYFKNQSHYAKRKAPLGIIPIDVHFVVRLADKKKKIFGIPQMDDDCRFEVETPHSINRKFEVGGAMLIDAETLKNRNEWVRALQTAAIARVISGAPQTEIEGDMFDQAVCISQSSYDVLDPRFFNPTQGDPLYFKRLDTSLQNARLGIKTPPFVRSASACTLASITSVQPEYSNCSPSHTRIASSKKRSPSKSRMSTRSSYRVAAERMETDHEDDASFAGRSDSGHNLDQNPLYNFCTTHHAEGPVNRDFETGYENRDDEKVLYVEDIVCDVSTRAKVHSISRQATSQSVAPQDVDTQRVQSDQKEMKYHVPRSQNNSYSSQSSWFNSAQPGSHRYPSAIPLVALSTLSYPELEPSPRSYSASAAEPNGPNYATSTLRSAIVLPSDDEMNTDMDCALPQSPPPSPPPPPPPLLSSARAARIAFSQPRSASRLNVLKDPSFFADPELQEDRPRSNTIRRMPTSPLYGTSGHSRNDSRGSNHGDSASGVVKRSFTYSSQPEFRADRSTSHSSKGSRRSIDSYEHVMSIRASSPTVEQPTMQEMDMGSDNDSVPPPPPLPYETPEHAEIKAKAMSELNAKLAARRQLFM